MLPDGPPPPPPTALADGLVDAHHHLWDLSRRAQPWLDDPGLGPIRRTFALDDLRAAATRPVAGRRLQRTVLVQCIHSIAACTSQR